MVDSINKNGAVCADQLSRTQAWKLILFYHIPDGEFFNDLQLASLYKAGLIKPEFIGHESGNPNRTTKKWVITEEGRRVAPELLPGVENPLREVVINILSHHQVVLLDLILVGREHEVFGPNDFPMNSLKKRGLADFEWIDREAGRGRWVLTDVAKTIVDFNFYADVRKRFAPNAYAPR